ncbi:HAD family hydrolase [Lachnospiraceae bacterium WCA-693-APC-MOT-I]|uniref:HAD family hydrolase n=2 Tax=Velocimicrobium porci TaxID=2606634 RepID=A0A6L5Y0L3_9FIRM|nr:HAD family hydrolase [Velocimicrobium porci]
MGMSQKTRNIKLICSDIDGTLVPDGTSEINKEVFDVILALKEKGIIFAAASGRQYESIRNLFERIANDIIIISENGNLVMCRGEVMARTEILKEDVQDIKKRIDAIENCQLLLSGVKTTYIRRADRELYRLMKEGYHYDITLVDDFDEVDDTIIKMSLFQKDGRAEEVAGEEFMDYWSVHPRISAVCAGKEWIDLFDKDGNKGNAVEQIQKIMGIKVSETMVFGDNLNDIEMLHRAEYSYAVGNAREEVQREANYIADTNVNDGVLKELKKLLAELD